MPHLQPSRRFLARRRATGAAFSVEKAGAAPAKADLSRYKRILRRNSFGSLSQAASEPEDHPGYHIATDKWPLGIPHQCLQPLLPPRPTEASMVAAIKHIPLLQAGQALALPPTAPTRPNQAQLLAIPPVVTRLNPILVHTQEAIPRRQVTLHSRMRSHMYSRLRRTLRRTLRHSLTRLNPILAGIQHTLRMASPPQHTVLRGWSAVLR
ncbi:hypothetical protein WJX72_005327 [[Myrmecia] bisecta]|uniref:Uncharacterized protein n=1 Tax=[Myrmecia] bisecta TaxID=41462 RepID=A0AAW1PW89_9CHLO